MSKVCVARIQLSKQQEAPAEQSPDTVTLPEEALQISVQGVRDKNAVV